MTDPVRLQATIVVEKDGELCLGQLPDIAQVDTAVLPLRCWCCLHVVSTAVCLNLRLHTYWLWLLQAGEAWKVTPLCVSGLTGTAMGRQAVGLSGPVCVCVELRLG